jgi:hypothetical protein
MPSITIPSTVRIYIYVFTVMAAVYTSFGGGLDLLWGGINGIASIALFLVPAVALPVALLAWSRSGLAAALFIPLYALNILYKRYVFKNTVPQLLDRHTGFWELSLTTLLLVLLVTFDLAARHHRASQSE